MSFTPSSDLMNLNLNIQLNRKVDKDQIGNIWTALNKCKNYIDNGQRLEYMSWRLWQLKSLHHSTPSPAIAHDAFPHEVSQHGGPIKTQDDQETIQQKRVIIIDDDEDYFYSEEEEEIQYEFIKLKPRPPTSQKSLLSDLLQREQHNSSPPSLSNSSTSSHSFDSSFKHPHHLISKQETHWQQEHKCW